MFGVLTFQRRYSSAHRESNQRQDDVPNKEVAIVPDNEKSPVEDGLSHKLDRPNGSIDRAEIGFCRRSTLHIEMPTIIRQSNGAIEQDADGVMVELNQMQLDTINDIKAGVEPIIGYAAEPLLPLVKACAPLNGILHDLNFYVQLALNETPEIPLGQLTIDESAAIRLYTIEWEEPHRSLYSMLNHTLKKGSREELRPYFKYMKLFMTALVKLPCAPPLTIWRGITKDQSAEFPPGTLVTWWSFSSCTTALSVLENNMYLGISGERTLFSVETINGRTIRDHSYFVTEDEILLLPGTHMIVQSQFSPADQLHIIHLKQVVPEEVLLEPPFEGKNRHIFRSFLTDGCIFMERCTTLSQNQVSYLSYTL